MRALFLVLSVSLVSVPAMAAIPANDNREYAVDVDALPFVQAFNTLEATTEASDPSCSGRGATVWYSFTPEHDVHLELNTFGSTYDTTLSAYIPTPAALMSIGCNDDAMGGVQSQLTLDAVGGVTYYVMVASFGSGPGGDLVMTIDIGPRLTQWRLDSSATLRQPGVLTLNSSTSCSQTLQIFVAGQVVQSRRHRPVAAEFNIQLSCEGRGRWPVIALPRVGLLTRGDAVVLATVSVCGEQTCETYRIARNIRIQVARSARRDADTGNAR
jgi:hypothetical protein